MHKSQWLLFASQFGSVSELNQGRRSEAQNNMIRGERDKLYKLNYCPLIHY